MAQGECKERISVSVRIRPMNRAEQERGWELLKPVADHDDHLAMQDQEGAQIPNSLAAFDRVFSTASATSDVYGSVADPIVDSVLQGFNGTIFAYGQTAAGKTFTMQGSKAMPGVLPLSVRKVMSFITGACDREFLLRCSYVEIYNEEVRDLLQEGTPVVQIRQSIERGVFVEAHEQVIGCEADILQCLQRGERRRQVAGTDMNHRSSRSHTIFRITVESRPKQQPSDGGEERPGGAAQQGAAAPAEADSVLVGTLSLVDLAGSESVRLTNAAGQRLKEAGNINKSLLALSRVISELAAAPEGGRGAHISFRNSKLTRLLQPSLAGNTRTAVICCVSPSSLYQEETKSTLNFASSAKAISTVARPNEVLDDRAKLRKVEREVAKLRKQLLAAERRAATATGAVDAAAGGAGPGEAGAAPEAGAATAQHDRASCPTAAATGEDEGAVALLRAEQAAKLGEYERLIDALRKQVIIGGSAPLASFKLDDMEAVAAATAAATRAGGARGASARMLNRLNVKGRPKKHRETWCPSLAGGSARLLSASGLGFGHRESISGASLADRHEDRRVSDVSEADEGDRDTTRGGGGVGEEDTDEISFDGMRSGASASAAGGTQAEQEVAALRRQLAAAASEMEAMQAQTEEALQRAEEAEEALDEAEGRVAAAEAKAEEAEATALQAEPAAGMEPVGTAGEAADGAAEEMDDHEEVMMAMAERLQAAEDAAETLRAQLADKEAALAAATGEAGSLRAQLADKEAALAAATGAATAAGQDTQARLEEAETEVAAAIARAELAEARAEEAAAAARRTAAELEQDRTALMARLQTGLAKYEETAARCRQLERQLEGAEDTAAEAREAAAQAGAKNAAEAKQLASRVQKEAATARAAEQGLAAANSQLAQLGQRLAAAEAEAGRWAEERSAMQARIDKLDKVKMTQGQMKLIAKKMKERDTFKDKARSLAKQLAQAAREGKQLLRRAEDAESRAAEEGGRTTRRAAAEIDRLRGQLEDASARGEEECKRAEAAEAEAAAALEELDRARASAEDVAAAAEGDRAELEAARAGGRQAAAERDAAMEALAGLRPACEEVAAAAASAWALVQASTAALQADGGSGGAVGLLMELEAPPLAPGDEDGGPALPAAAAAARRAAAAAEAAGRWLSRTTGATLRAVEQAHSSAAAAEARAEAEREAVAEWQGKCREAEEAVRDAEDQAERSRRFLERENIDLMGQIRTLRSEVTAAKHSRRPAPAPPAPAARNATTPAARTATTPAANSPRQAAGMATPVSVAGSAASPVFASPDQENDPPLSTGSVGRSKLAPLSGRRGDGVDRRESLAIPIISDGGEDGDGPGDCAQQ